MAGVKINFNKLPELARKSPQITDDAVQAIAREGERFVKQSFGDSPPGVRYNNHIASRGGYPPNVDTGKLRAGINVKKVRMMLYSIGTGDTEYAVFLEFGTVNMQPRPFMQPMEAHLKREAVAIARKYLEALE